VSRRERRLRGQLRRRRPFRCVVKRAEVVEAVDALQAEVLQGFGSKLGLGSDRSFVGLLVELDGQRLQDLGAIFVILEQRFGKMAKLKKNLNESREYYLKEKAKYD
jgi:hypothetical protein